MEDFARKALDFYEVAEIAENLNKFDVVCSNYFKALTAINDFVLAKNNLSAKDHNGRFALLNKLDNKLYRLTSAAFLVYRRTYTGAISKEELKELKEKLKEALKHAGIGYKEDN